MLNFVKNWLFITKYFKLKFELNIAFTGGTMHKFFNLFIVLVFGVMSVYAGTATTLEEAKAMSAKTGKPILMDFMTEW